jgi:hypothetical protein
VADIEDAPSLAGRTLWVKAGYQMEYWEYSRPTPGDASPSLPLLAPMEKIIFKKIIERRLRADKVAREVVLVFEKEEREFATVIGMRGIKQKGFLLVLDDLFFPRDPHEIYGHWSPEIWKLIENHQIKESMSFIQSALSLGSGQWVAQESEDTQVCIFPICPGGGKGSTRIKFVKGKVREVKVSAAVGG